WDAFRALYATTQDYAWFTNESAHQYLTNCEVGPLCFLEGSLGPNGLLPSGFNHDGSQVRVNNRIEQTRGLDQEQLAMYGAYLPFLYYADRPEAAQSIITRLESNWNSDGYWGNNPRDYYNQNWVWFGLMLVNSHPEADSLFATLQALPAPTIAAPAPIDLGVAPTGLLEVDSRLGQRDQSCRPRLNQDALVNRLNQTDLEALLTILTSPYPPTSGVARNQTWLYLGHLQNIAAFDNNSEYTLYPYFSDLNEYWNNAITLASAYSQLANQSENRQETMNQAIDCCIDLRAQINSLTDTSNTNVRFNAELAGFPPADYNLAQLALTEAELRAQLDNQDISFYEEGIALAVSSINTMLNIDRHYARPDYNFILKALITIADLNLRLYESTQALGLETDYFDQASMYYSQVANLANNGIEIDDQNYGLILSFNTNDIDQALLFNQAQGYLTPEQYQQAQNNTSYLQAIATVKQASLLTQQGGEINIGNILSTIVTVNNAINELELTAETDNDYFLAHARIVKADLLLFLADSAKYAFWPYTEDRATSLRHFLEIETARDSQLICDAVDQNDVLLLFDQLELIYYYFETNQTVPEHINSGANALFDLTAGLYNQANDLYQQTPPEFSYLYTVSRIKMTEIGVRTADFIDSEFRYLVPFNTDPALRLSAIPDSSFLDVEQTYLRALLLASADQEREALDLLDEVIRKAESLDSNYQAYFQVHARLKIAEIYAKSQNPDIRNVEQARSLFAQIEEQINALSEENLRVMAWRPYSFLAELYQEWASASNSHDRARQALEMCFLSDSSYDFRTRRNFILLRFNYNQALVNYDNQLQQRYNRHPDNGH
ncbi:MAG: hypothetical protein KJ732_01330, partial [Candidatus Margulisbacteria bacterium]|nr:hypothetical protein [Candidatus Margulisiibacteriota bacterium]